MTESCVFTLTTGPTIGGRYGRVAINPKQVVSLIEILKSHEVQETEILTTAGVVYRVFGSFEEVNDALFINYRAPLQKEKETA